MTEPRNIGHYRIEAHLGSGKFCDVYRAVDTVRRRTVALRTLKPGQLPRKTNLASLLERAGLASDLVHPHIAWIWETGEADGYPYLAERFVNGPSLSQMLKNSAALPWDQARKILQEIAQGLDYAHGKGWVHGDITLESILFSPDLGAVLVNFGLANALLGGNPFEPMCAPEYIPPEILDGEPASPAGDQYSLACVLVEITTGKGAAEMLTTPDGGESSQPSAFLPRVWPEGLPWGILGVLERALAHNPADRYPSVGDFVAAALETPAGEEVGSAQTSEARAWRQEQEALQRKAEEAARLAALEQARREIEEQVRRETQADALPAAAASQIEAPPPTASTADMHRPPPSGQRRRRRSRTGTRWPLLIAAGTMILALAGLWFNENFSASLLFPPTPTETPQPSTATHTPTLTTTETPSPTHTYTQTLIPTNTPTAISRATQTPTYTPTPTDSPMPTAIPTDTREPRDRERDQPIPLPFHLP